MHNVQVAAGVSFFFLDIASRPLKYPTLMLLTYFAERRWLVEKKQRLTGGPIYCTVLGPALGWQLELFAALTSGQALEPIWSASIAHDARNATLSAKPSSPAAAALSPEVELMLEEVWFEYGRSDQIENGRVRWINHFYPEWRKPLSGFATPLPCERILQLHG